RRTRDVLGASRAMSADGEAMRLVAQPLQEIEHRIARLEREGRLARHEEALASRIAVRPLGDADHRNVIEAELGQHAARRLELALAAVDQPQVRPAPLVALGFLLELAAEAAANDLAHHGEVTARRALALDVELAVAVLDEAVGARHHHGADRRVALDVAV